MSGAPTTCLPKALGQLDCLHWVARTWVIARSSICSCSDLSFLTEPMTGLDNDGSDPMTGLDKHGWDPKTGLDKMAVFRSENYHIRQFTVVSPS